MPFVLAGLYSGNSWLQEHFGSDEDFFAGSFVTRKDPEAISEFYQAEDLLRLIAIHPILFNIFMKKVDWDTKTPTEESALLSVNETHARVKLLGMEVSFEIIEQEEETEDGDARIASFNRHERFVDWVPILADWGIKILLWDQTWNYGFNRLEDGSIEVYHCGERFYGPWPVRMVVFLHQRYVLWACEKYINGESFGTEDIDAQLDEMACLPLHVFKSFLAKLRAEKERSLESANRQPIRDEEDIAKTTSVLEKLDRLEQQGESTIKVARRPMSGSGADAVATKLVVADKVTQEALQAALKDAKGNREVNAAMQELCKHPELEWKGRPPSKVRSRKQDELGQRRARVQLS
jgi:hypothetical protein